MRTYTEAVQELACLERLRLRTDDAVLASSLSLRLRGGVEDADCEADVGAFSLDILAKESGTERRVAIENQLEDTNHDHLGKLITYSAGLDVNYAIWVVRRARDEHRKAIEWLNEVTGMAACSSGSEASGRTSSRKCRAPGRCPCS